MNQKTFMLWLKCQGKVFVRLTILLFFVLSYLMLFFRTANANPSAVPSKVKITGNAGMAGVTLTFDDRGTKTVIANDSGNYTINVPEGWSGTITPSLPGYIFTPPDRTYSNLMGDQINQDYTATIITYVISGNVGVASATLSYLDETNKTVIADESGNYSITVPYNWSGAVTPSLTAYSFTPDNRVYENVLSDQIAQDYNATLITYTISGNVGVGGAVLKYTDESQITVTADSWGNYSLIVSYNWSGTITPIYSGYTFTPVQRSYENVLADLPGENYTVGTSSKIYYVNNIDLSACSDLGEGISPESPFCTIGKATSQAIAGDTIRVLAGTYAETVKPRSGIAGYPVTVSANPGVTVTGLPGNSTNGGAFRLTNKSHIIVDGFNITGTADFGIYVLNSNNITISNNQVSYSGDPNPGSTRPGIYLDNTTDSLIQDNISAYNSNDGIVLIHECTNVTISGNVSYANAAQYVRLAAGIVLSDSRNNIIIHNITYANEDSGINLVLGSSDNKVIGNVSYGNGDHGIDNSNSPNNIIVGNTVQGNVTVGINLEGASETGSSGATVMNNVLVDNGYRRLVGGGTSIGSPGNIRVEYNSRAGTTLDYNLYYLSPENGGTIQVVYEPDSYSTLADFKSSEYPQEANGLEGDPLLVAPAPPAERPPAAPFTVAENVGDNHISAGSPAIDSANADAPDEWLIDMDGNKRVDDFLVTNTGSGVRKYDDRGAYEFQPVCYTLTINSGVNGSIPTTDPVKSDSCKNEGEYIAGQVIQLAALPDTGYQVASWTGTNDDTSVAMVNTVTMPAEDRIVGVTYKNIEYQLMVTSAHGTVTKNPDQDTYHYGDVVQLTATPDAGWSFNSWSNGLVSTANPVSVTIQGDLTITANYIQNGYTLSITSLHGTVTKNPDQDIYHYGDVVQLTATPDAGWSFNGWSGDASGADNQISITINGDTSVVANYAQYKTYLALIVR